MNQSENKESQVPQTVQISHLQLLINAVVLAYHRNAYTLKEAGTIWKALEYFINTGNAVMPQVHRNEQQQQQQQQQQLTPNTQSKVTQPSTQVSPVTQAGQKTPSSVHTIQPEESKPDSNLILNVVDKQ
uniref:Uncharacterized protein n=1 Tax=viral metagenome TaxID=1070528 RepID=A0A6C0E736_9ZZZZ